jgi:hypothetical protein
MLWEEVIHMVIVRNSEVVEVNFQVIETYRLKQLNS